jgi:hypothetical protein
MLPPLATALSLVDVMAKRFHMSAPLRKKQGAVNLSEYQAAAAQE